jgi:hypothetical protein
VFIQLLQVRAIGLCRRVAGRKARNPHLPGGLFERSSGSSSATTEPRDTRVGRRVAGSAVRRMGVRDEEVNPSTSSELATHRWIGYWLS